MLDFIYEPDEIDHVRGSLFDTAMEAASHVIDKDTRTSLPDKAFGIVFTDKDGKRQRKYPLVVKNDPEATERLVAKAISFFHYCNPEWKPKLARKIVSVINSEKLKTKINTNSQIFKYVSKSALPKENITAGKSTRGKKK